ncbi:WecB/TagA/CpsF family glycosyltransferase [Microbulbifer guangxiensis]|uniref:WecB/TagA/CpsF family glycosyltransferase n=1 Tax=Microbulbifer guangxiensis TaxID=2904249 RepID=UPI001F19C6BB|nr:WecB/TagA/CpsF family glycosyltransferase [Microbulbifer guangxiensis]
MEAYDSSDFRTIVNEADWVIPDGRPLSWAQRRLGHSDAEQVRGQDIMNALCESSGRQGWNIGLYGGSSDKVLTQVVKQLRETYPDISITFAWSPPFRELSEVEDEVLVSRINLAQVNVLFVGIGCPKQERWMAKHKDRLNCVMLGVGAAFDFVAGSKRHAPRWVQKLGLEWLFRLCSEPKRLWKRYLKQNPRFIYHFCRQWLFNKSYN